VNDATFGDADHWLRYLTSQGGLVTAG